MSPVVVIKKKRGAKMRPSEPPLTASWVPQTSDIFELTVPPGEIPLPTLPDSIEAALLSLVELVPGAEPSPELPPEAEPHRRKALRSA